MNSITAFHHKTSDNRDDKNVQFRKLNGYLGTVLDKGFSGGAIKVNNVVKYSLADKIALQAGDLITKLANKELNIGNNSPRQVINNYLKTGVYGEEVVIEVLRNGSHGIWLVTIFL